MRSAFRIALIAALFSTPLAAAHAQTDSFEQMIENALKNVPDQAAPDQTVPGQNAPSQTAPQPSQSSGQPSTEAPAQAPAVASPEAPAPGATNPPLFVPVEPGPRPYTPPKLTPAPAAPSTDAIGAAAATNGVSPAQAVSPPGTPRTQESLTVEEVNSAVFPDALPPFNGASPLILKAQIMLDRAGASPGVIDAYSGGNLKKAVSAVETVLGLPVDGILDKQAWDAIGGDNASPVLVQYQISAEDLAYPYVPSIPQDYAAQAKLGSLGYTSPEEMLAERFHMDGKLLKALNPNADFRQAGTEIWVTDVKGPPITAKVVRIVADEMAGQLRAYDAGNRLIVAYPATIGSADDPSPSGNHLVKAVMQNPVYDVAPADIVQGGSGERLQLPPGPNNPLGSVWIDLTDPGYGIQGTPDASTVGKPAAHGCIILTNWDAEELASLVEPGIVVTFLQ